MVLKIYSQDTTIPGKEFNPLKLVEQNMLKVGEELTNPAFVQTFVRTIVEEYEFVKANHSIGC